MIKVVAPHDVRVKFSTDAEGNVTVALRMKGHPWPQMHEAVTHEHQQEKQDGRILRRDEGTPGQAG